MKKSVAVALMLLATACGSKKDADSSKKTADTEKKTDKAADTDKKTDKKVETKTDKVAETPKPADNAPVVKIDPEVAKRVKAIVDNCKIDEVESRITDCKNKEDEALLAYGNDNRDKSTTILESVAEIGLTDGAKDKKTLIVTTQRFPQFDMDLEKKLATPGAVDRVLKLYAVVPKSAMGFVNAAAVPLLAGKHAELTAALNKMSKDNVGIRQDSLIGYITFGGIDALPDLQSFYKAATNEVDKLATVTPAVGGFRSVAEADRPKLCDWGKEIMGDTSQPPSVQRAGGDIAVKCGGAYIDAVLTMAEASIKANKVKGEIAIAVAHTCAKENNSTKEQCDKAVKLLETSLTAPDADPNEVGNSLYQVMLMGKGSDDVKAPVKALLTKLSTNKDKDVAATAKQQAANLK